MPPRFAYVRIKALESACPQAGLMPQWLSLNGARARRLQRKSASPLLRKTPPIQRSQIRGDELAIFPNQFAVEINFAAAVIRPLNANHVPMDLAAISVIGVVVGLARR